MRPEELKQLLASVREGTTSVEETLRELRLLPTQDLGFARLDTHRELRQGVAEAIYCEGKTPDQVVAIARRLLEATTGAVLATRADDAAATALLEQWTDATHHPRARLVVLRSIDPSPTPLGTAAVVTGGTADEPIALEAAVSCDAMGVSVDQIADVGVAGAHRVFASQDRLHDADVVIVVAGMDGALASLVGGIVAAPVVAVPTSVGYGASFEGLAALLTMLNSCAPGVAVMNIDNGFGAAVFAVRVLRSRLT